MDYIFHSINPKWMKYLLVAAFMFTSHSVGNAASLPFVATFDTQDDFDQFLVKDNDNDGLTWVYDSSAGTAVSGGSWGTPDDWMITPEFVMEGGREYSISFTAASGWDYYEQHFSVRLGQGDDISAYTDMIAEDVMVNMTGKNEFNYKFKPSADGNYRIAFNVFKSTPFYGVILDDVNIEALADPNAPAAVGTLTVTPGEAGTLSADVTFTVPALTVSGSPITSVDRITVSRGGTQLTEYVNMVPGSAVTFHDADAPAGKQTYSVTPYIADLQGVPASIDVWIGPDVPASPVDFFVADNLDNSVTMSWTLPDEGANGGYIDKNKVSYQLFQYSKEGEYIYLGDIDAGIEEARFNIGNTDIQGQQIVLFGLLSETAQGTSPIVMSNEYIIGEPYPVPYLESFAGGNPQNGIWIKHSGACEWSGTDIASCDDDKGAIVFTVPLELEGETYTNSIESGKLDLTDCDNPGIVFRYLAYPGKELILNTLVRRNGGKEYKKVHTVDYTDIGGNDNEWRSVYIPLTDYKDASYITVSFQATATDPSTAVVVDAVEVRDVTACDLSISYEKLPQTGVAGNELTLYVRVDNTGYEAAKNFKIDLYSGDKVVSSLDAEGIAALSHSTYELKYSTSVTESDINLRAEVCLEGDVCADNNATAPFKLILTRPDYDKVNDLRAEMEGDDAGVKLSWSPVVPTAKTVTDDVEKYDPFTITDLDPWITQDVDQMPSIGLGGSYPHKDEVFPYIVFNPVELGLPVEDEASAFQAHSGNQYFAAITGQGQNDDWLISEKLSGQKQTVSLFARSYNVTYGCEKFEILYSDGTRDLSDFKAPEGTYSFEVPAEWTEYSVEIPEGAQYFAIHYISPYVWMLMIDDISYTPAVPVVSGYNVYRDNKLIGTVQGGKDTVFQDNNAQSGDHAYNVTVVYDGNKESDLSNTVTVSTSGIKSVIADTETFMEVYDIDGRLLFTGTTALGKLGLNPGIYIVKSNGSVSKTLIR